MRLRQCGAVLAAVVTLAGVAAAAPASADDVTPRTSIVYSETYLRLIVLFPAGWAQNDCWLALALSGGSGFCHTIIDPVYFYPNGSLGSHPWIVDPSSPTGWSIPSPCAGVESPDSETWAAFVDGTNYPDSGIEVPPLTDAQIECGGWLYGWWF